jgi:CubicO group peptidase (beta-lactamase class C family)
MSRSTFAQPLPKNLTGVAASAHIDGKLVEGRWHIYPELAAAGLWTTPTDFTKFMLAIRSAWLGEPGALLEQNTAREMLTPHEPGGYGLGPGLGGSGDTLLFAHPGGNFGFAAFMMMYPKSGDGIVIMNNGGNPELNMEIVRAAAMVYDWPHFKPEVRGDAK